MVRRLQLLEDERPLWVRQVAALGDRIRDGLLHDNKVIPAVLGVLALLVFAWLIAGVLIGDPDEQEEQQASNQAALSQTPEEDPESERSEAPAPEVENPDADSFAVFEPKDPFRELVPPAAKDDGESTNGRARTDEGRGENARAGRGTNGDDRNGRVGERTDGGSRGVDRSGRDADGGEDFIDQTFPEEGRDSDAGDRGEVIDGGTGRDGGAGQDGAGNLFGSGGDLPPP